LKFCAPGGAAAKRELLTLGLALGMMRRIFSRGVSMLKPLMNLAKLVFCGAAFAVLAAQAEVKQIVKDELERIKNDESLSHLLPKSQ